MFSIYSLCNITMLFNDQWSLFFPSKLIVFDKIWINFLFKTRYLFSTKYKYDNYLYKNLEDSRYWVSSDRLLESFRPLKNKWFSAVLVCNLNLQSVHVQTFCKMRNKWEPIIYNIIMYFVQPVLYVISFININLFSNRVELIVLMYLF
jgi:hypothetical protein